MPIQRIIPKNWIRCARLLFMLPEIIETVIGVPLLTKALSKVNMNQ